MPRVPLFPEDDESTSTSSPTSSPRKKPRRAPHGRRQHRAAKAKKARKPRAAHAHARVTHPDVAATTGAPLGAAADPWHASAASGVGPGALLDLTADAGLGNVILELVGAERANLGSALGAWQREQDRLLNRAWRRPGGLARPAGL